MALKAFLVAPVTMGTIFAIAHAYAQSPANVIRYPERPVRVIVPVAAGGGTDIIARLTVTRLSEVMGQSFVIDNRPGTGGVLGNEIVAQDSTRTRAKQARN